MKHADPVASLKGAAHARNIINFIGSAIYRLDVRGSHHVPSTGPVILAANHLGFLDGPVLVAASPRPVHTLSKSELFVHPVMNTLMHGGGQISIDYRQPDRAALARAVATLRAGQVLGVFPEGHRSRGDVSAIRAGIGYVHAATHAPVVPVAILGTRTTGKAAGWIPPLGHRISVVFGQPLDLPVTSGSLRGISETTQRIRQALEHHVLTSISRTGIALPDDVIVHPEDFI